MPFAHVPEQQILLICGHYGVGKSNLALNIAIDAASAGREVTLIDMDLVNPYFRSSEYRGLLELKGVYLIAPNFAGTSLDNPSLSSSINGAIENAKRNPNALIVLDIGGDDVGATALGRYTGLISQYTYRMFYVVNPYRNMTREAKEALEILSEIEEVCDLHLTDIVLNAHLKNETTAETIINALPFASEIAQSTHVPIWGVCVPNTLINDQKLGSVIDTLKENIYPVNIIVKTPWE